MTQAQNNHRRVLRRSLEVSCEVVRERDFVRVSSQMLDVSPAGMCSTLEAPVLTGESVVLTFREPRTDTWFDATARVVRVGHGRRGGDDVPCIGLEFESLDRETQVALFEALRGLPPPLPRSRAGESISIDPMD